MGAFSGLPIVNLPSTNDDDDDIYGLPISDDSFLFAFEEDSHHFFSCKDI